MKYCIIVCSFLLTFLTVSKKNERWEKCGKIEYTLKKSSWNPKEDYFQDFYIKHHFVDINRDTLYSLRYKILPDLGRDVVKTHSGTWICIGNHKIYKTKCDLVKAYAFRKRDY